MLRHHISMTYFYIYFNQFKNVLECYEETTVRRHATATHTHSHTNSCLQSLHKVARYEIKIIITIIITITIIQNYNILPTIK